MKTPLKESLAGSRSRVARIATTFSQSSEDVLFSAMRPIELTTPPHHLGLLASQESAAQHSFSELGRGPSFNPSTALHEFTIRFPRELELFKLVGIHPSIPTQLINPYTHRIASESFANIGEHCLAVATCADTIARSLMTSGLLSNEDRNAIVSRALVHDLTKPYEIMRRDAAKSGAPQEVYSAAAYEKLAPLLTALGISPDIASYLRGAGAETGHLSLKDFIVVGPAGYQGLVPGKIGEKIVHLADDMTSTSVPLPGQGATTHFVTPAERVEQGNFRVRYPFLWREGLGVTEQGAIVPLADLAHPSPGLYPLGSYAELQVRVGNTIAREIQLLIAPENRDLPERFVKQLVESQLR